MTHFIHRLGLRVYIQKNSLVFEVRNEGSNSVRLWQQNNSWGWSMIQVSIIDVDDSQVLCLLRPRSQDWTRNIPRYVELQPKQRYNYVRYAYDFDPVDIAVALRFREQPLILQPRLVCDRSADTMAEGVWFGELEGEKQRSDRPHQWLIGTT
jgi:hypothetical protein